VNNVTVEINTTGDYDLFIESLTEFENLDRTLVIIGEQAMNQVLKTITERVRDKSTTAYGTQMHKYGKKTYSDSHEWKRKLYGVQTDRRDLNLTGDMWESLKTKERKRGADVKIVGGVTGSDRFGTKNEDKMMWNSDLEEKKNSPARVAEISEGEEGDIVDFVAFKLNEAIAKRLKKLSK